MSALELLQSRQRAKTAPKRLHKPGHSTFAARNTLQFSGPTRAPTSLRDAYNGNRTLSLSFDTEINGHDRKRRKVEAESTSSRQDTASRVFSATQHESAHEMRKHSQESILSKTLSSVDVTMSSEPFTSVIGRMSDPSKQEKGKRRRNTIRQSQGTSEVERPAVPMFSNGDSSERLSIQHQSTKSPRGHRAPTIDLAKGLETITSETVAEDARRRRSAIRGRRPSAAIDLEDEVAISPDLRAPQHREVAATNLDAVAPPRKIRARDRMQLQSTKHTLEEDELAGGNTISSQNVQLLKPPRTRPKLERVLVSTERVEKSPTPQTTEKQDLPVIEAMVDDTSATHKAGIEPVEGLQPGFLAKERIRRSTRHSQGAREKSPSQKIQRWSRTHKLKAWSSPLVYPQQGLRRVTVDFQDIERLDEGEFLNDNLIAFALRRIEENLPAEMKDKIHFFNTYFYTALTVKNGTKAFNYDAVKKWTKNKDLLSTDYIVVPINHDLHWFVAIICNLPNLQRQSSVIELEDELVVSPTRVKATAEPINSSPMLDSVPPEQATQELGTPERKMSDLTLADDAQEKEKELIEDGIGDPETPPRRLSGRRAPKKRVITPRKFDSDRPSVITLDSFGSARSAEVRMLKEYIVAEAQEKRQVKVIVGDLQGMTAKGIPQQDNFCDCGVYLIAYLEAFAQNPRKFVDRLMSKEMRPDVDFPHFSPSAKREELRNALLALAAEQVHPDRRLKKMNGHDDDVLECSEAPKASKAGKPVLAEALETTELVERPAKESIRRRSKGQGRNLGEETVEQPEDSQELESEPPRPFVEEQASEAEPAHSTLEDVIPDSQGSDQADRRSMISI